MLKKKTLRVSVRRRQMVQKNKLYGRGAGEGSRSDSFPLAGFPPAVRVAVGGGVCPGKRGGGVSKG